MRIEQERVETFHAKMDYPIAERPTDVEREMAHQRYSFIREESDEYLQAALDKNLVGIADALADILYVVLGTAIVHGIDIQPIFDAVHKSNMSKDILDPVTKKGGKGPNYKPPTADIASLLLLQRIGAESEPV